MQFVPQRKHNTSPFSSQEPWPLYHRDGPGCIISYDILDLLFLEPWFYPNKPFLWHRKFVFVLCMVCIKSEANESRISEDIRDWWIKHKSGFPLDSTSNLQTRAFGVPLSLISDDDRLCRIYINPSILKFEVYAKQGTRAKTGGKNNTHGVISQNISIFCYS
jgi:hypothetical protein